MPFQLALFARTNSLTNGVYNTHSYTLSVLQGLIAWAKLPHVVHDGGGDWHRAQGLRAFKAVHGPCGASCGPHPCKPACPCAHVHDCPMCLAAPFANVPD
mmetsp:Transcript_24455/g.53413  ORF Transcript_24455/g.53413 Transcript_24455/m.53413 type:complete len:100 (+) Transcript_24455:1058-1357(+)